VRSSREDEERCGAREARFAVLDGWATDVGSGWRGKTEEGARLPRCCRASWKTYALVAAVERMRAANRRDSGKAAENAGEPN